MERRNRSPAKVAGRAALTVLPQSSQEMNHPQPVPGVVCARRKRVQMAPTETEFLFQDDTIEAWRLRIGKLDPRQIAAWRAMTPAQRLDLACQAYQFALDVVRLTERQNHPDLSPEELAWRVTRRMQEDRSLGRENDRTRPPE